MPQPQVLPQRPISRPSIPRRVRCRGSIGLELVPADRCDPSSDPFDAGLDDLRRHQP